MALFDTTQISINLTAVDKWIMGGLDSIALAAVGTFGKLIYRVCTNCIPSTQHGVEGRELLA
jgi:hypothetical protein